VKSGYQIKAVLFDFDGTLTRPGAIDFKVIKKNLGCPTDQPVLEFIHSIASARDRRLAMDKLDRFEVEAARKSVPNSGAQKIVRWIKQRHLPVGIITRNSRNSVLRSLENFDSICATDFDLIVTRDDPPAPKPSGDGVVWAAKHFHITPSEMLVVGDFIFDPQAGHEAGALTALLDPAEDERLQSIDCDFRIGRLDELQAIIRAGLPLPAGKLPNDLLQNYLAALKFDDPSVLIQPGVGEDITAIEFDGNDLIVLKSDPITFATEAIGRYAVAVNANDIATAGAIPRWFLTTLLLPCGITPSEVKAIMKELAHESEQWGVTLCGGHTEITDAVNRPVVVGQMVGTVNRRDLVEKRSMRRGDKVLLTKGVAVEGTAIIAREFETRLVGLGITAQEIHESRNFLKQISVLPEAGTAAEDGLATAMHDVTEGGLATALMELSIAGGHQIRVETEQIPVYKVTQRICTALGLDPLGLIGSGSLLICCRSEHCDQLIDKLEARGIEVSTIGQILDAGQGIKAFEHGKTTPWPEFETDEIARLYE
jgi:hydrogenase maturation factor/phosphoglycolate phosphatase-like HAD superfamily hydrolase